MTASKRHNEPVGGGVTAGGGSPSACRPGATIADTRVIPEIQRTWERANVVMPPSDPTDPADPSTNLATLAAIAHAKWTKADEQGRYIASLEEQLQSAHEPLSICAYCGVAFEWDKTGDSCPGCKQANDLQKQLEAYESALRLIHLAEPDDTLPQIPWPSFAGRLQSIAGEALLASSPASEPQT